MKQLRPIIIRYIHKTNVPIQPIQTFKNRLTNKLLFCLKGVSLIATSFIVAELYTCMCPSKSVSDIKDPRHLYDYDNDDDT